MEYQELSELIIKEVMRRIGKKSKRAFVLFTGGTTGFDEAFRQVEKFRDDGWDISILFTVSAEKIYRHKGLLNKFEGFEIYFESEFRIDHEFLKEIDIMLIPMLTMNTAVKIALGISDTPATHLVSSALLNGITIIAAKDACNPRSHKRDGFGINKGAEAYAKKMESYLKTIEEYGLTLVSGAKLYEAVVSIKNRDENMTADIKKRIITKEDIVKAKKDGSMKIIVSRNTKVTSYAEETADELGVEILCI